MAKVKVEAFIFGGTFDPIHEGHVGVIKEILQDTRLVVVAPTSKNPWKKESVVDFATRLEMIRLVLEAEGLEYSSDISEQGIYLSDFPYIYVSDFVSWWRAQTDGEIHWVVGRDLATQVSNWKDWDSLDIGLHVAENYADNLHSIDVRNHDREIHPALRQFVLARSLYF